MRLLRRDQMIPLYTAFLFCISLSLGCGSTGSSGSNASAPASPTQPGSGGSGGNSGGSGGTGSGGSSGGGGNSGGSSSGPQSIVYVASLGAGNISAFSLSNSGSLTELSGSPYSSPSAQRLAISGSNLIVVSGGFQGSSTISAFKISAGGGLAHGSDVPISTDTFDVAGNSSQVFAGTKNGIYSFTVNNGALVPVAGSPFFPNDPAADPRTARWFERLALDPAGAYLFVGITGNRGAADFAALPINNGALARDPNEVIAGHHYGIAISPARNFLYRTSDNTLLRESFDPATGKHAVVNTDSILNVGNVVIDAAGKYVLALMSAPASGAAAVRVFDVSTGTAKEVSGSPFSTGGFFPSAITFDVTGHFALIAHGDTTVSTPSNNVSVMSFDSSTGALALVGSPRAVGNAPMGIVSGKF